jgi:uncharacterized protein YcfL
MMQRIVTASVLGLAVVAGGAGCKSANTTTRDKPTYEADSIKSKNVVTDGYARDYAKVLDVRQATVPGDIMKVQVEIRNDNVRPGNMDYKFEWFDGEGMIVDSPSSIWKSFQIMKGQIMSLSAVAPDPRCKDFRLTIQRNRRS